LETRFPEDTGVRFSYLAALGALVALNHGEPAKAIELLRIAVPCELGVSPSTMMCVAKPIWPNTKGAEAAAEFQKVLNHRGIVIISDPIGLSAIQ
jgi:eukaryotic-like serine/threonine-protein kinase